MLGSLAKHTSVVGIYHLIHIHIQQFVEHHQATLVINGSCNLARRIVYDSTVLPLVIAVKNSVAIHISTTHIACGSLHSITIFISDFRQLTATFRTSHFYEMTVGIVLHLPSELTGIGSAGVVYGVAIFHIAIAVELQVQFGNIALVICHGDFCAVFRRICLRFGKEILEDGFFPILTYDTCHQSFFVLGDRHPGSRLR